MDIGIDIGANLDAAMKIGGFFSQTALALRSGVSQSTINRILQNRGSTDAINLYRLAKACGVSVEFLYTGKHPSSEMHIQLSYITQIEADLLTYFRICNAEGRRLTLIAAQEAAEVFAQDPAGN